MTPTSFLFIADENIHPAVVAYLRDRGTNVVTVQELHLSGMPDSQILQTASDQGRVVLTHDRDFGTLTIASGQPVIGIVYLRPGHINPQFTIATLSAIFLSGLDPVAPFLLVASQRDGSIRIRLRRC